MRVVVTGSAGFIGSHLVRELVEHGHEVIGADIAAETSPVDLLAHGAFSALLDRTVPDLVVHLAARVGRLFGEDDVRRTVRSNVEMTTVIARACGERDIRLAYASTSEIYGDRGEATCHEDDRLDVLPHNLYGLTKRQGEEVCQLYAPDGLTIFRFSMPYGPGVPPGRGRRAMDTMLWQAHHRMPITVHRGAERSWCWIGDTVRAVRLVLEGHDGVWNVGRDDDPRSMLWLAERACELTGAPRDLIEVIDPPARQTVVKRLSTSKLRAIGWRPEVKIDEGIAAVLDSVRRYDAFGRILTMPAELAASSRSAGSVPHLRRRRQSELADA